MDTVPTRYGKLGDPWAGIDDAAGSLEALLDLAARHKAAGLEDAPPDKGVAEKTGRRRSSMPLIEIARAAGKEEALAGLERWKARYPKIWSYLEPADVLVDSMRGRSSTWTRVRLNLRNVPEMERPPQETLEVDFDPWRR
jgi:hypothetical protein